MNSETKKTQTNKTKGGGGGDYRKRWKDDCQQEGKPLCAASKFLSGNCIHLEPFPPQKPVLFSSPHANRTGMQTKPALQTKQFI